MSTYVQYVISIYGKNCVTSKPLGPVFYQLTYSFLYIQICPPCLVFGNICEQCLARAQQNNITKDLQMISEAAWIFKS